MTPDELVPRLSDAALKVIRREAGSLAFDTDRIRGVTIDLSVAAHGVVAGSVYVERAHRLPRGPEGD